MTEQNQITMYKKELTSTLSRMPKTTELKE